MKTTVLTLALSDLERSEIQDLSRSLCMPNGKIDASELVERSHILAHQLPIRIRENLYEFKSSELSPIICIKNNPFQNSNVPPTPIFPRSKAERDSLPWDHIPFILYAASLGELFSWSTFQEGSLVTDVFPVSGREEELSSSASLATLALHTEDAFHHCAPDYLGLFCLRNHYWVPTIVAPLSTQNISEKAANILFQSRFIVGANSGHSVEQTNATMPIFFGNSCWPYFRVNINLQRAVDNDPVASDALTELERVISAEAFGIAIAPGDCLFLDNFRVAHGRGPFQPSYDGNDRWLRRVFVTSNLRISRQYRKESKSRVIVPREHVKRTEKSSESQGEIR